MSDEVKPDADAWGQPDWAADDVRPNSKTPSKSGKLWLGVAAVVVTAIPLKDVDDVAPAANETLYGHAAGIYTVAFSPDSAILAAAGFDGMVRLYDASTGQLKREFIPVPLEKTK